MGYVEVQTARRLEASVYDPAANDGAAKSLWQYTLEIPQHHEQRLRVVEYPRIQDARKRDPTDLPGYVMRRGEVFRFLRSQADMADPTRIAVDYTLDGQAGKIELRLGDDNRLRATIDRGSKTVQSFSEFSGTEVWDPRSQIGSDPK